MATAGTRWGSVGLALGLGVALVVASTGVAHAQDHAASWTPPHTSWGDPDISGIFTNKDENGTPFERPDEFGNRTLDDFEQAELEEISVERDEQARERAPGIGGAETGAGPPHWYEHLDAQSHQAWLVTDPPDGHLPEMTAAAQARRGGFGFRRQEGAQTYEDLGLYQRCITRALPGSMMPAIYGNSYQIVQTPGYVAIRYEMVHETRIIPLDGSPHVSSGIRSYMGDARGHWEGDTLVVETTNLKDGYRGSTENVRLVERFTRRSPTQVYWEVTVDDPDTWTRTWSFGMPLTQDDTQMPFEYACHEGNRGLENILTATAALEAAGVDPRR